MFRNEHEENSYFYNGTDKPPRVITRVKIGQSRLICKSLASLALWTCVVKERGTKEVWPLQEEEFKGCHVHSVATTMTTTTTTMKRRRRPHNRWSSVIKMKNYALLRLSSSSTVSVMDRNGCICAMVSCGSDQLDSLVRKCRGKSKRNGTPSVQRMYK